MPNKDRRGVLAANAAFYAAFRAGDLEAMQALWSKRQSVRVLHPNARGIEGREAVMRSWEAVLIDGGACDILPADASVILSGKTAMVVCEEHMGGGRMIATNVFVNERGDWRLVHHQATRLPAAASGNASQGRSKGARKQDR